MMMKSPFCMPRLARPRKSSSARLSPAMSLLDRLREAVFRLIMLSALSKGSSSSSSSSSDARRSSDQYYYNPNDDHHTEAVADCIEFIKKSSATASQQDSTAINHGYTDSQQVVIPLPVM